MLSRHSVIVRVAPKATDQPQIEAIVAKVREKNYGFRSLIHEIVASELFRTK